jgi:plasmid stabilization system protein ParE
VPRVELSRRAIANLDWLITTHSLPADTRARLRQALQQLANFPNLGRELGGRWADHRVILGPWRWMLVVYRIDEANDRVVVVTIQDARSSSAAATRRG